MAYIGKQPVVGNFVKLDAITTSATATYNLLNGGVAYFPQTANNCIVSLNGVIQSPTSAYTISGSTIVFDSALTSSDTIDFILVLGDVLSIGTPSDATVTNAKLALTAGSVGTPTISPAADTNTGIFFSAADTIDFAEGGIATGQFDSSGNFKFNSGYGSVATAYGCRAWVQFNGSSNNNLTGTYTRTSPSTTVTVTATAHGLIVGNKVRLDFTTGTGLDGEYEVVTVADANTFTVTTVASTTTSGNVTLLRNSIVGSGNVSSVSDNGTGDYIINMITSMPDANYCVVANAAAVGSVDFKASIKGINNSGTFSLYTSIGATPTDSTVVCTAVFR